MSMFFLLLLISLLTKASATSLQIFSTASGVLIPLEAIRKQNRNVHFDDLQHIIFEYNATENLLFSHHITLSIYNLTDSVETLPSSKSSDIGPTIRTGPGDYTFVFQNTTLVTAWGPNFNLHPLDSIKFPRIFLNSISGHGRHSGKGKASISNVRQSKERQQGMRCPRIRDFEIALVLDTAFCKLYDNSEEKATAAAHAIVNTVHKLLKPLCINIRIPNGADVRCENQNGYLSDDNRFNRFNRPNPKSCPSCRSSKVILDAISSEWEKSVASSMHRDAVFFFSGYEDNTLLTGATYRTTACNNRLSYAWVTSGNAAVLAHEIGHRLGARHDKSGFMKPKVNSEDVLEFSDNSKVEMKNFVEKDSRGWCLRRNYYEYHTLKKENGWKRPLEIVFDIQNNINVSDVTFASLSTDDENSDLISLVSEQPSDAEEFKLMYTLAKGMACDEGERCPVHLEQRRGLQTPFNIGLHFPINSYGFGIAFGHLQTKTSRDIIISHVHNNQAYYQIGYDIGTDGKVPTKWSKKHVMMNLMPTSIQCASISLGHLHKSSQTDIVHVHIDKRNRENIAQYLIGFNLGPEGSVNGGWSKAFDVPSLNGESTTAVSAALLDADGDGKQDLIMYHVDNTPTHKVGYVRVGRSLDATGKVTGGWSDYVQVPHMFQGPERRGGTMAVRIANGGSSEYFQFAVTQRQNWWGIAPHWNLIMGTKVITPKFMNSNIDLPVLNDVKDGCNNCYNDGTASQCKQDLGMCSATVNEVRYRGDDQDDQNIQVSVSTVEPVMPGVVNDPDGVNHEPDDVDDDEYRTLPKPPSKPDKNSVYCTGFHYFYTKRGGCHVFGRRTILAKGAEIELLEVLKEVDEDVIIDSSNSSFEAPKLFIAAGVHGIGGAPIAVVARIKVKAEKYSAVVKAAFKKLRERPGFANFQKPTVREITFMNNRYIVTVVLKFKLEF